MRVDELVALVGSPPPAPSSPLTKETIDEIVQLYNELYAPGLAAFFESLWFDFQRPPSLARDSVFRNNEPLLNLFASFLQVVENIKSTDPSEMIPSSHIETRVVWALACLAYSSVPPGRQPGDPLPPPADDHWETRSRLHVFEALLSGGTISSNPLSAPPLPSTDRSREFDFWHQLAQYLLHSHSADTAAREQCLAGMRSLLDNRENRDVLYSMAVLRELSGRMDPTLNEQTAPTRFVESDPRSRLAVATRFIREAAASTGGTTNVVRRFAVLAYKAFIRPGVNSQRAA